MDNTLELVAIAGHSVNTVQQVNGIALGDRAIAVKVCILIGSRDIHPKELTMRQLQYCNCVQAGNGTVFVDIAVHIAGITKTDLRLVSAGTHGKQHTDQQSKDYHYRKYGISALLLHHQTLQNHFGIF